MRVYSVQILVLDIECYWSSRITKYNESLEQFITLDTLNIRYSTEIEALELQNIMRV